jgi:hypothetical protein
VEAKESAEEFSRTLRQGNISLILEGYDDIFSDFDPRSYSERALSDDFLNECRKASHDKPDEPLGLELRILVPKKKRSLANELKIRRRLKSHFEKHYHEKKHEQDQMKADGLQWFFVGVALIFLATILYQTSGFFNHLLFVMSEPAGWFTLWNGLDKLLITPKEKQPELEFYGKMAHARCYFFSY